jgi:hypothetical protein
VVASAFAQYYIFASTIFAILCLSTSGMIYSTVLTASGNTPLRIVFEVLLGMVVTRLLIEFGNRVVFRGSGVLAHPVLWTWYSTYLLVVYLIRGILAGIIRMLTMFVWIVVQIGIVDRSNFPEGKESSDPAFSAFFQTLRFHHRRPPAPALH